MQFHSPLLRLLLLSPLLTPRRKQQQRQAPLLRLLEGGGGAGGAAAAAGAASADAADADDAAGRVAPALCALARRAPPGEPALALSRAAALAAARRLALRREGPAPMLAADCVALIARAFVVAPDAGAGAGAGASSSATAALGTATALAAVQVTAESAPGSASNAPTDLPPSVALASAPSGENAAAIAQQEQPSSSSSTSLLHVALRFWACHQQDLLGASAINAAVAGLAALAALPSPSAVDAVLVRGTRVEDEEEEGAGKGVVIRTRARARAAAARPERWVGVTARAKAVQLLADALVEAAEGGGERLGVGEEDEWDTASDAAAAAAADEDESDDDESDEGGPKSHGGNSVAASLARAAAAAGAGGGCAGDLFAARAFLDDGDGLGLGADGAFDGDPLDPLASASPGEIAARGLRAAHALFPRWMQEVGGALLSAGQRRAVAAAFGVVGA